MPRSFLVATAALLAAAVPAVAQDRGAAAPREGQFSVVFRGDGDKARLGVTIGTADTAGIPVTGVLPEGPAAKAGVREGDRLVGIDAVDLRVARADADDPAAGGIVARRLTRHLDATRPGTEVTLRLVRDGAPRTVRATTVRGDALDRRAVAAGRRADDRAALGLVLGGTPGKRDTLGVFVTGVYDDGPAARAGIVEGDRLASIGGVSLRVDPADAGDAEAASARVARLTRELARRTPGDVVELTVVRDGRSRVVRVTTGKASEVAGVATTLLGALGDVEIALPRVGLPQVEIRRFRAPAWRWDDSEREGELEVEREAQREVDRALQRLRTELDQLRPRLRALAPPRRTVTI